MQQSKMLLLDEDDHSTNQNYRRNLEKLACPGKRGRLVTLYIYSKMIKPGLEL